MACALGTGKCFTLACSGYIVSAASCTGMCVPATAAVLGAALRPDGRTVALALNSPARPAAFACSRLLAARPAALFGAGTTCVADGSSTVTASLPANARLLPGDALELDPSQTALTASLTGAPFVGTAVVDGCAPNCPAPVIVVTAPTVRMRTLASVQLHMLVSAAAIRVFCILP